MGVLCPYCAIVDGAAVLIGALSIVRWRSASDPPSGRLLPALSATALVASIAIPVAVGFQKRAIFRGIPGDVPAPIAEEDVIITVSRAGYVKRLPVDAFKKQGRGGKGVRGQNLKEEDVVKHVFTTTTHHWMLFFTTKGRVYRVKAHEIPESGRTARGMYAANLPRVALDGDERISAVIDLKDYAEGRYLLFATRKGIVKKTKLPEYDSSRSGLIAV